MSSVLLVCFPSDVKVKVTMEEPTLDEYTWWKNYKHQRHSL